MFDGHFFFDIWQALCYEYWFALCYNGMYFVSSFFQLRTVLEVLLQIWFGNSIDMSTPFTCSFLFRAIISSPINRNHINKSLLKKRYLSMIGLRATPNSRVSTWKDSSYTQLSVDLQASFSQYHLNLSIYRQNQRDLIAW